MANRYGSACFAGDSAVVPPTGWLLRGDMAVSVSLPQGVVPLHVDTTDSTGYAFGNEALTIYVVYGPFDGTQSITSPGTIVLRETWCIDGQPFEVWRYQRERSRNDTSAPITPTRVISLSNASRQVNIVAECRSSEAEATAQIALRTVRLR